MALRLLVADDHTLLRAGIRSLLERTCPGIVVGEAWLATCFEALGCPLDERAGVRVTPLTVPDHAELCRVIECLLALDGGETH